MTLTSLECPDCPPVLLVVPDDDVRASLGMILSEVGYDLYGVASLKEALAKVEEVAFALVLADLYVGPSQYAFTPGHVLRRRVAPSPMGLLYMPPLTAEAVEAAGFAFAVPMPFEIEDLLSQIAVALDRLLTPAQQLQAATVTRYLEALATQDWEALLALCTEDIVYHPAHDTLVTIERRHVGREALRTYVEGVTQLYRHTHHAHLRIYARPHGLVARYTGLWESLGGSRRQAARTVFFRFHGERISQIGIHGSRARPQAESTEATAGE